MDQSHLEFAKRLSGLRVPASGAKVLMCVWGARGVGGEKKGIRLESHTRGRRGGSGELAKSHPGRVEPARRLFGSWLHLDRASPHLWLLRCQSRGEGKKGDGVTRALSGSGVFAWKADSVGIYMNVRLFCKIVHFTKKAS